ncbi:hypothetical protein CHUAL_010411 [Chamberlinius hualienensis]
MRFTCAMDATVDMATSSTHFPIATMQVQRSTRAEKLHLFRLKATSGFFFSNKPSTQIPLAKNQKYIKMASTVSEFRRKKLMHVFNVIFDFNRSGTIEEKDFDLAIEKICRSRQWTESDPKAKETRDTLFLLWESLKKKADKDKDGSVSAEEWCTMWTDGSSKEWQQKYMEFMFNLEDTSGDGEIDEEEFVKVYKNFNLDENELRQAYQKFSKNNSVKITKEVFSNLWSQYFSSENPADLGNFIFGRISFD